METPAARAAMDETGGELRMMAHWKQQQQRRDVDSSSSSAGARLRCWQSGEVEVEDRWGIGSMSPRPHSFAPPGDDRFQNLKKLASRQLQGSRRLQQAGHRLFSCFRHSTLNLRVQHTAPSTPPKSGPLPGQRTSISSIHGVTFKGDALDLHTDRSQVLNAAVEPTSPVVNCMGQVISNKMQKHGKLNKTDNNMEMETEMDLNMDMNMDMDMDMDKLRRTKSQAARGAGAGAPSSPPGGVWRSKSCKWKQLLLRSNSSSISPSFFSHPACEGEPQIDLCRFSSATASSEPFYRQNLTADKRPDKTCLFMQSMQSQKQSPKPAINTELSHKQQQQQQQLDAREHGNSRAEPELVVRNLPKLKTKRMESPKWLADEPALQRRQQGLLLYNNNKPSLKKSSETSSTSRA